MNKDSGSQFKAVEGLATVLELLGGAIGIGALLVVGYLMLQNGDQVYGVTNHTGAPTIVAILIAGGASCLAFIAAGQLLDVLLAIERNTRPAAASPGPALLAPEAPEPKPDGPRFATREEYERFKAEHKEAGPSPGD